MRGASRLTLALADGPTAWEIAGRKGKNCRIGSTAFARQVTGLLRRPTKAGQKTETHGEIALIQLCNAQRYERTEGRRDTRAGHYERSLHTKAGEARLKLPKLRRQTLETAIIERYRRRESSVGSRGEALIEMYLAGVSVRRCRDGSPAHKLEPNRGDGERAFRPPPKTRCGLAIPGTEVILGVCYYPEHRAEECWADDARCHEGNGCPLCPDRRICLEPD